MITTENICRKLRKTQQSEKNAVKVIGTNF